MRILLDMDGVVCNYVASLLEQYNILTSENVKEGDMTDGDVSKFIQDPYTLKIIKNGPGFFRNLKPMPGAVDAITKLHSDGHEIFFVSNGSNCPTSGHEKRDWIKFYFHRLWKYAPLVLTYHKYITTAGADVILEDTPRNLNRLEGKCKGLLYHHKYNSLAEGYDRIYDWSHFLEWIERND